MRSGSQQDYLYSLVPASGGTSFSTTITLDVPAGSDYQAVVAWRPTAGSGDWINWGTSPGSFTVDLTIAVTAPMGTSTRVQGIPLTVSWTTSGAVSSGEFCVWLRERDDWYVPKLVAASGGTSFSTTITLDVPTGASHYYQAIVAYRPTAGSGDWINWGTSPGMFTVVNRGVNIDPTAPTGTTTHVVGSLLTVSWTTSSAVSTGAFTLWAHDDHGGGWYIGKQVAASGAASYSTTITLDVPAGSGYTVWIGYWPPEGGDQCYASSPGTFTVVTGATADLTGLALSGSPANYTFAPATYAYSGVTVLNAVTSVTVTPSGAGVIRVEGAVVASGSASAAIALTAGTAKTITVTATEAGKTAKTYTIEVTRGNAPVITVTAPAGSTTHYQGSSLTVSWTTDPAATGGEFGVWARSAAGDFYIERLLAAGGGTSFYTFLVLDVPLGSGYQAIVAWRPTAGSGDWVSFGTSPGSFTVTRRPPRPYYSTKA